MAALLPGRPRAPYLLQADRRAEVEKTLKVDGFSVASSEFGGVSSSQDASVLCGRALEYPDVYRGGWDGFFDLLCSEFQERPRRIVVNLLDSDRLARRDLSLFVNISWALLRATETVEAEGAGEWQLEFL
ncbi:barstar family protein [Allokutzneria sp. NRRL B-24872]|uniref:barstar family protein n=1 Tax=Allokutzneria sp. NRRL B-24872 TaxID=1137961 RepID=UPI000A39B845|nr:barstar family protein [Allokutzneria sp. NRRL B-24872]